MGDFNSYNGMGDLGYLGSNQVKDVSEDEGMDANMTGAEDTVQVQSPKVLFFSDIIKRLINNEITPAEVVEAIKDSNDFDEVTKSTILSIIDNPLQEMKSKIKSNFQRFL